MLTMYPRAFVNASNATTVAGTIGATDTAGLTFTNTNIPYFPVVVAPVVAGAGATATTVATALVTAINNNASLAAADIIASNAAGVITILGAGSINNSTVITAQVTGGVTASPASGGAMSGGVGTLAFRNPPKTSGLTTEAGLTKVGNIYVEGPQQQTVNPADAGINVSAL
jgi:hypothetical protein